MWVPHVIRGVKNLVHTDKVPGVICIFYYIKWAHVHSPTTSIHSPPWPLSDIPVPSLSLYGIKTLNSLSLSLSLCAQPLPQFFPTSFSFAANLQNFHNSPANLLALKFHRPITCRNQSIPTLSILFLLSCSDLFHFALRSWWILGARVWDLMRDLRPRVST